MNCKMVIGENELLVWRIAINIKQEEFYFTNDRENYKLNISEKYFLLISLGSRQKHFLVFVKNILQ